MIRKPCAETGCRTLVPIGTPRCDPCQRLDDERRWQAADAARQVAEEARRLYATALWRTVRLQVFDRDGWQCRRCGATVRLGRGRRDPFGATCDHIEPHRGETARFFAVDNLQCLCRQCHNRAKQAEEAAARRRAPRRR